MPILTGPATASTRLDPDTVRRPIVTVGLAFGQVGKIEIASHRHKKSQFLLVQKGALTCEVEGGLWIVPARSAIWIPGGALHAVKATGGFEGYNAFVDPDLEGGLPEGCCALSVTPLLRELLIRSASLPALYAKASAGARLMRVLLDEIASARVEDLRLPMPSDKRLRRIADLMMSSPAARGTIDVWARRVGLSERTLARLFTRETGMSFSRWRRQLGVMLAVKWLAGGASIQDVANDLGYESIPSFVTMFRKATGVSPGRYMAERHGYQ
jgi:AraC-like DNA-binding protein